MPVTVDIELKRQFTVDCDYDHVFDSLADVPYSASHFPKVEELVDLGDECYRWVMEKIGLDIYHIQTIYTCEYSWDKEEGWIRWNAIDDEQSNAIVEGRWDIKKQKKKTALDFSTTGKLTLPLPRLAKVIIAPLVTREFEGLVERYMVNLRETWAGMAAK